MIVSPYYEVLELNRQLARPFLSALHHQAVPLVTADNMDLSCSKGRVPR